MEERKDPGLNERMNELLVEIEILLMLLSPSFSLIAHPSTFQYFSVAIVFISFAQFTHTLLWKLNKLINSKKGMSKQREANKPGCLGSDLAYLPFK